MATKIGGGNTPNINQIQNPPPVQNAQAGEVKKASQSVQSFEPSKATLSQQTIPQSGASQSKPGTLKAGLMPRNAIQVGNLLDGARQKLDKLGQQVSWRMGQISGQIGDLFKPTPSNQRPPIAALYGVIMPGIGGDPTQIKPPGGGGSTRPPIAAMYGVIMPGINENPGQTRPGGNLPPIQAMYGVIWPGPTGENRPPIQAMYGVIRPGDDWRPPIQPKYGVVRPPMLQADASVNPRQN